MYFTYFYNTHSKRLTMLFNQHSLRNALSCLMDIYTNDRNIQIMVTFQNHIKMFQYGVMVGLHEKIMS